MEEQVNRGVIPPAGQSGAEEAKRLRWLILYRFLAVLLLLLFTFSFQLAGGDDPLPPGARGAYFVAALAGLLTVLYLFLLRIPVDPGFHVRLQGLGDILLVTSLVHGTGGAESVYVVLYSLVIIYAVLFLGRHGGLMAASLSTLFYGFLLNLEYYRVLLPPAGLEGPYIHSGGYIFSRLFILAASFYVIALLASFVVEREKQARMLLTEKEDAFEKLDLLYRSIVESVDSGIMTVDREGRVKSFNASAERITGFSFPEIRDLPVETLFSGITAFIENPSAAGGTRRFNRFENKFILKGEKERILGFSLSPLADPEGNPIGRIVIFQDLTAIKSMEKEMERTRRLALVGEMAAVLAHEIRNPLSSISGSVQLLKKDLHSDRSTEKLMDIILWGKDQLEALLRDFLLLARPGAGELSPVDPGHLVDTVVDSLRYGPEWNENIRYAPSFRGTGMVLGSPSELRQVFTNIVANALQSMPEGGELAVTVDTVEEGEGRFSVEVKVADTGCGIEEERMEKIFEPFYTTKERGTGLGLAIVSRILTGHGGRIQLSSRVGEGTTAAVRLPLHEQGNTAER